MSSQKKWSRPLLLVKSTIQKVAPHWGLWGGVVVVIVLFMRHSRLIPQSVVFFVLTVFLAGKVLLVLIEKRNRTAEAEKGAHVKQGQL